MVTAEERYAKLDKRHHHFRQIPDPWHYRALAQLPGVLTAYQEGRVSQGIGDSAIHGGEWMLVWFSFDALGNPIQEWGFDTPPIRQ